MYEKNMTLYDMNILTLYEPEWPCTKLCDSMLLWMTNNDSIQRFITLYDYVCLCKSQLYTVWICMTLYDSQKLFWSVLLCLAWIFHVWLCVWHFDILDYSCSILFGFVSICLILLKFVWLSLTHAVMHKFCACFQVFNSIINVKQLKCWFSYSFYFMNQDADHTF